ncbi:Carbohydrate-binding domain family 9-like protein [Ophiocordyceps camponoti-floridani]|uniref:Carbohydrate-binding domain family 9-like protein n=1 Tax=Ophiocordyceps camponoti-floridani TaxID=2030778 RepID=A0A8H4QBW3_9HYPO|nr:Carbohydrate-binding domain family 9-like protein [Ophiocordyceps camponoti-floridani]
MMRLITTAVAFGATIVSSATAPFCPEPRVCFRWAIPNNSQDVMFQLQAPTTYRWVGLGIGSQMRGADMFVVYASGSDNVTLSTRRGTGHAPPQPAERSDVVLDEGSGISDGVMTANVRCSGCDSLNLDGSNEWIAAWQQGAAINSRSTSAPIAKHDGFNSFSVDMAQARGANNRAPFFGSDGSSSGVGVGRRQGPRLGFAHGVLMSVLFIFGFPVGSMLMPLVGNWIVHAVWQMVTFLAMWAGFGLGYYVAQRRGILFAGPHTTLGTCVCALMCLQPMLGYAHHLYFLKYRARGPISYAHIWYGRSLMILGLVNGGLGLALTGLPRTFVIVYIVLAIVFSLLYVGVSVVSTIRKMRGPGRKLRAESL